MRLGSIWLDEILKLDHNATMTEAFFERLKGVLWIMKVIFDSRDKWIPQLTDIKQTCAMFEGDNKLAANKASYKLDLVLLNFPPSWLTSTPLFLNELEEDNKFSV